jgi:hypothetical protein
MTYQPWNFCNPRLIYSPPPRVVTKLVTDGAVRDEQEHVGARHAVPLQPSSIFPGISDT